MKKPIIIIHPGPHKTGTTSIQHILNSTYGSAKVKRIWYPPPISSGPGHAEIAWSTLGINGRKKSSAALRSVIEKGKEGGAEVILISAECLSFMSTDDLITIKEICNNYEIYLIFTGNTIRNRSISLWQEMVKHGHTLDPNQSSDLVFSHPSLNPSLIKNFVNTLNPKGTVLVTSRRGLQGEVLHQRFFDSLKAITNIPEFDIQIDKFTRLTTNVSLNLSEALTLKLFNEYFHKSSMKNNKHLFNKIRSEILLAFNSSTWKSNISSHPLEIPYAWETKIMKIETETAYNIRELCASKKLAIYGSVDDLLTSAADTKKPTTDAYNNQNYYMCAEDPTKCFAHLLMTIHDNQISSTIPTTSRVRKRNLAASFRRKISRVFDLDIANIVRRRILDRRAG